MQAGEECGFHGNARKAELWVSVPALHCTGPRLSAALLSLSSLPHYISLPFTPSLLFPESPHLPPSCIRGSDTQLQLRIIQVHWIHVVTACISLSFTPFKPPDPHTSTPSTLCTSSGLSWKARAYGHCAAMCRWLCSNEEGMRTQGPLKILSNMATHAYETRLCCQIGGGSGSWPQPL